jgi:hypothetical protein
MTNPGSLEPGFISCSAATSIHAAAEGTSIRTPAAHHRLAYFSHFTISGSVGRLPYMRIPMR